MQISKRQLLRIGVTTGAILLVGWGVWQCQGHCRMQYETVFGRDALTSEYGWPMPHTRLIDFSVGWAFGSAQYGRTTLYPGVLVNASASCLVLVATGCVVWRWTTCGRQWSLQTVFGVFFAVAVLLGWWRWEYDTAARNVPAGYVFVYAMFSDVPMLTLLHSPWHVYVPVLFGLGCGVYWIGWLGGIIVAKIIKGTCHTAMSKLR